MTKKETDFLTVLDKGYIRLENYFGSDDIIIDSARISSLGSKELTTEEKIKFITFLIRNGHTSPLEQVEFRFLVKCPLFVARQWMRHRTWSYNEISRRYTSHEIDFYIPETFRPQKGMEIKPEFLTKQKDSFQKFTEYAYKVYQFYIINGVSLEQARIVLPQNMYTTFYAKTDLNNLFHFLALRRSPHAQEEIRKYAEAIEKLIFPIIPISYSIWSKIQDEKQKN